MDTRTRTSTDITRRGDARRPVAADAPAAPALVYRAGIDGLRALAVVAVVFADGGAGWMSGGFLGIEMLFVISGYLMTTLLVREHRARSRVDLVRFWARRARRVLPALLTVLGGVSIFVLVLRPDELHRLGPDVRAALASTTNWHLILSPAARAGAAVPSMLQHLWSVAIGVQFAVWWPLLFALLHRRRGLRRLRAVAWLLAVASAIAMVVVALRLGPVRAFYGTDTRASGLLIGAALGLAVRPGSATAQVTGAPARRLRVLSLLVLAGLVVILTVSEARSVWLLRGGILLVAILTALMLAAVVRGDDVDRLFGAVPLRWLGLRSYGIYLWHWPVLIGLGGPATVGRWPNSVLYLTITVALADLTYRFVEVPLCRMRRVRGTGRIGRPSMAVRAMAVACGAATVAALLTGQAAPADATSSASETDTQRPGHLAAQPAR